MTAPDHEPICGPSCTPDCGMGHCYLTDGTYIDPEDAHNASEHANEHAANQLPATPKLAADDLRQQLADVLRRRLGSQLDLFPHAPEFLADGVMAEAQPVLDAKDAEIKRLNEEIDGFCEDLNDALNHNDETCEAVKDRDRWQERAEDAEAERRDWQMAAQTAENELARLREQHQQIGDLP